jgi:hypothetical protein
LVEWPVSRFGFGQHFDRGTPGFIPASNMKNIEGKKNTAPDEEARQ